MEAADALSSALSKVATNLSTIQHAFSSDFSKFEKGINGEAVPNPEKLLARIKALEDRVTSLSSTASELVSSRPALIQETSAALLNNYVTLDYLAKRANYKEVDAAMNPFAEQASGTVATADRKEMALDLANQMRLIEGEEVSPVVGKVLALSSKIDAASAPAEGSDAAPATLLPATVNESEFQSLSNSVRGRSKLSSLNALVLHLTSLHNHTLAYKKTYGLGSKSHASTFYTLKELEKQGFKVTGATGTSILRSLENLGRIELSKKEGGGVRLLTA
ncbi:hypothetical protein TrST_g7092 [Triparma strigata]|uniref:Ska2 N-terminal domain-containing protein n=1 Tax=Triparma strigata TaxID=1606541 RepID=A0A9W7API8_9STRA|nr:hypothetical protein TrST_g7092 [Triparma strigata]